MTTLKKPSSADSKAFNCSSWAISLWTGTRSKRRGPQNPPKLADSNFSVRSTMSAMPATNTKTQDLRGSLARERTKCKHVSCCDLPNSVLGASSLMFWRIAASDPLRLSSSFFSAAFLLSSSLRLRSHGANIASFLSSSGDDKRRH